PSPNPVSGGAGSSLLKSSKIFIDFIESIARDLPPESFSVKMRTGFDDTTHFDAAIEGIKQIPMRQLTVHGRTRKDRYDGHARWDLIEKARAALPYPVVASGDILSYKHWQEKKALHPTLQNVIIGRGALRNPWIFAELREGGSLNLSKRSLVLALASFAQILELSYNAPEKLEALVKAGLFRGTCGVDEASWEDLWRNLSEKAPTAIEVERFAFGRTKMIWNSLRSSLPPEYFDPTLLRAKSAGEFLTAIASRGEDAFGVKHAPEWDWLYTSSRIKPEPNLSEQKVPL
ncbi:MAG: tRNA-dihydrouridine synthase family protein, partial [Proteobacteria bacterium]